MAYDVTKSDGTRLTIVPDRTVDNTSSIGLVGKNYAGYGEIMAENLVHIMEHFSSPSEPANPIVGQFWWNSSTERLYVYTATDATADGWVPLNPPLEKVSTKTANYTVTKEDHGAYLRMSSTSALAVTLPSTSAIPVGTKITIVQAGTGEVSITAGSGSTIYSSGNNVISRQWGRVYAVKTAAGTGTAQWEINGDLTEVSYSVAVSATTITEGQSVTYTVTTGRQDSHTVYWTLSGTVGTNDIAGGLGTSGSISMNNGTGILTITTVNDGVYEGISETMTLQVRTVSTSGTIVATADTVTISETSSAPTTTTTTTTAAPTTTTTTQAGTTTTTTQAGTTTTTTQAGTTTTTSTTTAAPSQWEIYGIGGTLPFGESITVTVVGPIGIGAVSYQIQTSDNAAAVPSGGTLTYDSDQEYAGRWIDTFTLTNVSTNTSSTINAVISIVYPTNSGTVVVSDTQTLGIGSSGGSGATGTWFFDISPTIVAYETSDPENPLPGSSVMVLGTDDVTDAGIGWSVSFSPSGLVSAQSTNGTLSSEYGNGQFANTANSGTILVTNTQTAASDTTVTATVSSGGQTVSTSTFTVEGSSGSSGVNPPVINSFTFEDGTTTRTVNEYDNPNFSWNISGTVDSITLSASTGQSATVTGQGQVVNISTEALGQLEASATITLTATNSGGSDTATIELVVNPGVSIDQFSLVPSTADDGESVTIAFQTSVADQVWIRREIAGGGTVDVYGTASSYQSVTPGQLTTGISVGNASFFDWGTGGNTSVATVDFLLTAKLSSDPSNTITTSRTLSINAPAGAGGFLTPESMSMSNGSTQTITLNTGEQATYTVEARSGGATATFSPSTVSTTWIEVNVEAQATFDVTATSTGELIIDVFKNSTLVATTTITVT